MGPQLDFKIDRSTDQAEAIAEALKVVPETMSIEKDEEGYPIVDFVSLEGDTDHE